MKTLLGIWLALAPLAFAEVALDRYNGNFRNPGTHLYSESWAQVTTRGNIVFWTNREGFEDVTHVFRCSENGSCVEIHPQTGYQIGGGEQLQLLRNGKIRQFSPVIGLWFEYSRVRR